LVCSTHSATYYITYFRKNGACSHIPFLRYTKQYQYDSDKSNIMVTVSRITELLIIPIFFIKWKIIVFYLIQWKIVAYTWVVSKSLTAVGLILWITKNNWFHIETLKLVFDFCDFHSFNPILNPCQQMIENWRSQCISVWGFTIIIKIILPNTYILSTITNSPFCFNLS